MSAKRLVGYDGATLMRAERAFATAIGKRLRLIRRRYRLTQDDVAQFASVSRWSVSCWESGQRTPSILHAISLTSLYGVSLDWLIGRKRT